MSAADPRQLKELLVLLSDRQLTDPEVAPMVDRALLALDDAASYCNDYPDDEWITDGFAIESQEVGTRLLTWVIFDELAPWLSTGDKADELSEKIVDRLVEDNIIVSDPPASLRTLDECIGHLNEELAAQEEATSRKHVMVFSTGFTDEIGLFIVNSNDVERIKALATRYRVEIT
jgi:hypothetical protein